MYGNEYFEWREAENALVRFERDLEALEPGARKILQEAMRKRYAPPDSALYSDLANQQRLLSDNYRNAASPPVYGHVPLGLFGGLFGS